MANVQAVGILHTNGEEEKKALATLELGIERSEKFLVIEQDLQSHKQPEMLVHLNLRNFKDNDLPMIVLISIVFLESLWKTPYKTGILRDLLNYVNIYCVHVWLGDLNEKLVKKFSSQLCRTDGQFRRIKFKELGSDPVEMVNKLQELLLDATATRTAWNYIENYALDGMQETLAVRQRELSSQTSASMLTDNTVNEARKAKNVASTLRSLSLDEKKEIDSNAKQVNANKQGSSRQPDPKKKKTDNIYKFVSNLNTFGDIAVRDNIPSNSRTAYTETTSASSKKRKKKKKTSTSLMSSLSHNQLHEISVLLDVGFGANWKQVASAYDLDYYTIQSIELALQRQESPSMNLLALLRVRIPELQVGDFLEKCRNIARFDVVSYIEQDILKN